MFEWDVDPITWSSHFQDYMADVMDAVHALAIVHADRIQTHIRQTAPWQDDCMPGREYLKADVLRDDEDMVIEIRVWYDQELYDRNCPDRATGRDINLAILHEMQVFRKKGRIGVVAPAAGAGTVLGDLADEFWDAVRALFA